jgi:integrase
MWERYLGDLPGAERKPHGAERTKAPGAANWQRQKLSEITHQQVSKLRLDLGAKVGRTTANRVIELLSAMFNFAKQPAQRFFIGENPAEGIGKFEAVERERYLRSDEAPKFFDALNEEEDQDFADYVRLSIYTGARRGNVLRMQWSEISLSGAVWTLSGEQLKNGEPLTIPLVQQAVDVLQKRTAKAKGKAWVFPGDTAQGHMGPQRKKWLEFVKRAGAPDLRVHDLRRSLGSWMANSGASTVVTMRALGHKTVDAALIYQRLAADPVREAAQRAVTALMDAAKAKPGQLIKMPARKRKAR